MTIRKTLPCLVLCAGLGLVSATFTGASAEPAREGDTNDQAPAAQAKVSQEMPRSLELAEVAVCRNVENRTPVEGGTSFPTDVGRLFCFTDVRNAQQPTQIFHRWYVGEAMVNEIPMTVKGPRWRCWSEKTIPASWSGTCRVEVVTEEGSVLGEMSFDLDEVAAPRTEPTAQETSAG